MASARRHDLRVRGSFVPLSSLSVEQQTLLSAVPRWKRAWVRPSHLKEGQKPDCKVCKWVIDTAKEEEQGTAEEMQAAQSLVASGEASSLPGNDAAASASGTDAMEVESAPTTSQRNTPVPTVTPETPVAASATVTAESTSQTEPQQQQAPLSAAATPTTSQSVTETGPSITSETQVEPIQEDAAKIEAEMKETRKEGDDFQEDEVQLAKEAEDGMVVDQ